VLHLVERHEQDHVQPQQRSHAVEVVEAAAPAEEARGHELDVADERVVAEGRAHTLGQALALGLRQAEHGVGVVGHEGDADAERHVQHRLHLGLRRRRLGAGVQEGQQRGHLALLRLAVRRGAGRQQARRQQQRHQRGQAAAFRSGRAVSRGVHRLMRRRRPRAGHGSATGL
jgi:hypothetical protein